MYRLFLCIRYLRSKVLPLFAMVGVALCVFMMLVAVSVMTGFQHKIEQAAKGLFGDIVIEAAGERGIGYYDELVAEIEKRVPEVEGADVFILSFGMLRVTGDRDFRQHVQIAGIRLPSRAGVTDFEEGLFVQENWPEPTFDPSIDACIERIEAHQDEMRQIIRREFADELARLDPEQRRRALENWMALSPYLSGPGLSAEQQQLLRRMTNAGLLQDDALRNLRRARQQAPRLAELRKELAEARARNASQTELLALQESIDGIIESTRMQPPADRVILGLGIPGLSFRTERGETVRYLVPGHEIVLYIAPLGKRFSPTDISPNIRRFTIIDDNHADVSSIDTKLLYVPFDTLQELNNMGAEYDAEGQLITPARCSQIHLKVRGEHLTEADLRRVAAKVRAVWESFRATYTDRPIHLQPVLSDLLIETWRQRQAQVVGPIEKQRTLVIIVTGIMSIVAVALIFVILYTIVVQKTREIGVLKAVGAGGLGIARLFFLYGAVIGAIGAVVGTVGGFFFVRHINDIQDWVDRAFGFRVWSREQFMFESIPNEVDWPMAVAIFLGSIAAGLLGSLLPAIRAARMEPVEALRYE
jgi:lipoprotein-releasing system permease protein